MSKALTLSKTIYSNWNNGVMSYLNDIRKYDVLTPDEEVAIFDKIKNGTEEERTIARQAIINHNQRFIYAVAKEYAKGNDIMDIIIEANIGFNEAIDKFDVTKGVKFISYAIWYMRRAIVFHITNNGAMVRTSNKQKLMGVLQKAKEKFFNENEREGTTDEIIDILEKDFNISVKNEGDVYDLQVTSISDTMQGDDDSPAPSQIEFDVKTASINDYEDKIEAESKEYLVEKLLSVCTEKERGIIKALYGIGYDCPVPPEDVADMFGMTKTRILQLRKNIINKMQKASKQIMKNTLR